MHVLCAPTPAAWEPTTFWSFAALSLQRGTPDVRICDGVIQKWIFFFFQNQKVIPLSHFWPVFPYPKTTHIHWYLSHNAFGRALWLEFWHTSCAGVQLSALFFLTMCKKTSWFFTFWAASGQLWAALGPSPGQPGPGVAHFYSYALACCSQRCFFWHCEKTHQDSPLFRADTIQHNTIVYNTIHYNTTQHNTIQFNTIQYNTIQYNTIKDNKTNPQYAGRQYRQFCFTRRSPPAPHGTLIHTWLFSRWKMSTSWCDKLLNPPAQLFMI